MLVMDVHRGLPSSLGGTIRRLRLVGIPPKTHPVMNNPAIGMTRDDPGKFVLGTVPVEADGSAYFRVPSGVNFFLQALDQRGMAVQTMRTVTYVQPGQTTACVGCHEPRHTSVPNVVPVAMNREPSKIAPGPEGSWPLDYQVLVQPVLQKHCVRCHRPGGKDPKFDLTAEKSYGALTGYGQPSLRNHVVARFRQGRSTPGGCVSAMSPLLKLVSKGHYDVQLNTDERDRLITWMDTYAQRSGSFSKQQEWQLREFRRKVSALLDD